MKDDPYAEVEQPAIICRGCGFRSCAEGVWSRTADGRLVWISDGEIQPGRGPDLTWCSECGVRFTRIVFDQHDGQTLILPPEPEPPSPA